MPRTLCASGRDGSSRTASNAVCFASAIRPPSSSAVARLNHPSGSAGAIATASRYRPIARSIAPAALYARASVDRKTAFAGSAATSCARSGIELRACASSYRRKSGAISRGSRFDGRAFPGAMYPRLASFARVSSSTWPVVATALLAIASSRLPKSEYRRR